MSRATLSLAALSCAALLLMRPSAAAQGPHADTAKPFNGSSLAGWHPQGAAQWRVANGEIVGTSTAGPGWLVLDKGYQDIILTFAFQCSTCDAGVVLRNAPSPSIPTVGCWRPLCPERTAQGWSTSRARRGD